MADERLTEKDLITTPAVGDLQHIVDISDTIDHATGTSKKTTLQKIADFLASLAQTLTNKTLISPVLTTPKVDTINEKTAAAGVTVDGLLIKDGEPVIADAKDLKFASGAKIERDGGHIKLTPEDGKDVELVIRAKARASLGTAMANLAAGDWTTIELDTEQYDPGTNFASYQFTVPVTGYYLIAAAAYFYDQTIDGHSYNIRIWKNGDTSIARHALISPASGIGITPELTDILYLEAEDTIELQGNPQGVNVDVYNDSALTFMAVHLLSV